MKIKQILIMLTAMTVLLAAANCSATSITLTNSGIWNAATNWTPNQVPGTGDTAIIGTGKSITGLGGVSPSITTLTIQGTGSVTVDAGTLTVSGTATVGSSGIATLTVSSGATMIVGTLAFGTSTSTIANNGILSFGAWSGSAGAGVLTQGAGASLTNSDTGGSTPNFINAASGAGNTVTYNSASGNKQVQGTAYQNLVIAGGQNPGSGWPSSVTVRGTLTIAGSVTPSSGPANVNALTWSSSGSGGWGVNITNNLNVTAGTFYVNSSALTVGGTTTVSGGTLQLNTTSGANTTQFKGDLNVSGGTFAPGSSLVTNNSGSISFSSGTFTAATGTFTLAGAGNTIGGVGGTISIANVVVSGTYQNTGTLTVGTALTGTGTLTQGANSTLNLGGTIAQSGLALNATANTPNMVNYTKAGAQTVLATTYDSLTISGGGSNTKTLGNNMTVNTTLTIAASTLLADNNNTLTAKSGVVNNGTHSGTGKISLTGGSGSHSLTGTGAYGNLELNDANNASIASGTSTVNGTLTLTAGVLSSGGGALTFGPSAAVSRAAGSLSSLTPTFGTSINVTYNDVNPTTTGAELPSSGTALNNLTNANAAGVTLGASATLKGMLALNNGQLITGANTLTVTSAGTIVGGSSSSYVYGTLSRGFSTGSGKSGTFPVGDSSVYAPVSLASATVTVAGNLVVSTVANQNSQGVFSSSGLSQIKYVNRDWTITAGGGYAESAGSITLNFANDTPVGGMSTSADVVGKYSGGTWTHPTVASRTSTSITVSGITSFSDWVIGELPVPTFSMSSQTITYGASSKSLTGTLSANSGTVYPVNGSTVTASIAGHAVSGTVTDGTGDFTINYNDASLATDGVGSSPYTITYSFAGDANLVAAASDTSTTMTVNKAALSITANNKSKTYGSTVTLDGTVDFTPTGLQNSETVGSVTLTPCGGTAATDPVSGSPYTITPNDATGGTFNANNYTTITYNPGTLTVNPLAVSLTGSRAYDGTTNAAFGILSVANPIGSDTVTVASGTGGLAGKNVPAQAITSFDMLVLGNNAAGNYTLTGASGSVTITPINAPVVSGITADDKVYDGTNTATISTNEVVFSGLVSGDDVTLDTNGYSAVFASVNVDTNIAVTVSGLSLAGADAGNYTLAQPTGLAADITPAPLTVTEITASDKVYDGTTNAVIDVSEAVLVGVVDSDTNDVTLDTNGVTGAFTDANVGSNKTVNVSGLTINGSVTTNYTLTQPAATASITPASLTITADNKSRTFGLPNPVLTASYNGFVNGEDTNALTVQAVLSTMADTDSPVNTYPITVSGATAVNYTISYENGTLTVAPLPEISNVNQGGNQFVFTFPSLAGQAYQVEYNTNLTDSTWLPIGDLINGTGAELSATNNMTEPQSFFRLHILEQ